MLVKVDVISEYPKVQFFRDDPKVFCDFLALESSYHMSSISLGIWSVLELKRLVYYVVVGVKQKLEHLSLVEK